MAFPALSAQGGEKNKLMPKSKATDVQDFITAAQRLPKEAFTCPDPLSIPASSPCGLLTLTLWGPPEPLFSSDT